MTAADEIRAMMSRHSGVVHRALRQALAIVERHEPERDAAIKAMVEVVNLSAGFDEELALMHFTKTKSFRLFRDPELVKKAHTALELAQKAGLVEVA